MDTHPVISMIAAADEKGHIGLQGDMPWGRDQPSDLEYFKKITHGSPMIMGRKTFESLPGVLPGRKHMVLSQSLSFVDDPMVEVYSSIEAILEAIGYYEREVGHFPAQQKEFFIIGGAQIYELFFPYADTLYLTTIHASYEGDTSFPSFHGNWTLNHEDKFFLKANAKNKHSMTFHTFRRAW